MGIQSFYFHGFPPSKRQISGLVFGGYFKNDNGFKVRHQKSKVITKVHRFPSSVVGLRIGRHFPSPIVDNRKKISLFTMSLRCLPHEIQQLPKTKSRFLMNRLFKWYDYSLSFNFNFSILRFFFQILIGPNSDFYPAVFRSSCFGIIGFNGIFQTQTSGRNSFALHSLHFKVVGH